MRESTKTLLLLLAALIVGALGGLGGDYLGDLLMTGQSIPEKIRAQEFELVNKVGVTRGKWEALSNGSTILTLFDRSGKPRGRFLVFQDGRPGVALVDDKGTTKGMFRMSLEGKPELDLTADQEKGGRVPK